ncbi:MAG: PepSY-associated TM helix domain-containing protein [Acidobacteria bacterium]|nr:PepSY-associated TM helix domain-containing protein [Acidobacteriota bacterium]
MSTRVLWSIHRWAGLVLGLFLFVICLSGTVLVFREELEWAFNAGMRVTPQAQRASWDDVLAAAGPGCFGFVLPADPAIAITAYTPGGTKLIDPYTARVTGNRSSDGVLNFLRQLHIRLLVPGWQGRLAVGVFGLALLISALTGLMIYWPFMRGVFAQGLSWWQLRAGLRLGLADGHKLVGILTVTFILLIAGTGAGLGLETLLRFWPQTGRQLHPSPSARTVAENRPRITVEQVRARVLTAIPGLTPTSLLMPSPKSGHFTVYGNAPGHFTRHAASFVLVGAYDGSIVQVHDARTAGATTKIYDAMEPLHFGTWGASVGTWLRALYTLLGLAAAMLPVSGLLLWRASRKA